MDFLIIYLQTKSMVKKCIRDILHAIIYFPERYIIKDRTAMFFLGFFFHIIPFFYK